jgi:hypothetical protein
MDTKIEAEATYSPRYIDVRGQKKPFLAGQVGLTMEE